MVTLNVVAGVAGLLALLFLLYATVQSSRPKKFKARAIEFGAYCAALVALSAFNVPPASIAVAQPAPDVAYTIWPALRSTISSVALIRIGVLMLQHYGQRAALEKHIEKMAQDGAGGKNA